MVSAMQTERSKDDDAATGQNAIKMTSWRNKSEGELQLMIPRKGTDRKTAITKQDGSISPNE